MLTSELIYYVGAPDDRRRSNLTDMPGDDEFAMQRRKSLTAFDALYFDVPPLPRELEEFNLDFGTRSVKDQIGQLLNDAGIRTLTLADPAAIDVVAPAVLRIVLGTLKRQSGTFLYVVNAEVTQQARLVLDGTNLTPEVYSVVTWMSPQRGGEVTPQSLDIIADHMKAAAMDFIEAYKQSQVELQT